jgi:hypothetical protein
MALSGVPRLDGTLLLLRLNRRIGSLPVLRIDSKHRSALARCSHSLYCP